MNYNINSLLFTLYVIIDYYYDQNIKQYNLKQINEIINKQINQLILFQKNMSQLQSQQVEDLSQFIKQLPLKQRIPTMALYKLLGERQQIDNQQQQSIAKIKLSYHQKLKPLLTRASFIIRGAPLKQEEMVDAKQYLKPNENIKNYMKGKVIDNYWNSVLSNSPLVDQITENDQKALTYLMDVQNIFPHQSKQNQDISLRFVFRENPYFSETQVVRHLRVHSGQIMALQGDQLTWKQGKWLTHQKKKITNKKTGQSKIDKGKKIKSFFDLFLDWNAQNQQQLQRTGNFMIELANMIVMDSLDYFLGLINFDQRSVDQDEDDEEYDEEEIMEGGKRMKEN